MEVEQKMYIPKVSIIIPVYNTARFLQECLDSVINQTYSNLEIILIDDGSNDESGKICDNYAVIDSRIIVIHKENQGVSQARNDGMAIAQGEYIMFVDSDDWIDINMCSVFVEAINNHSVQAIMCSYIREYPGRSLPKYIYSCDNVLEASDLQRKVCGPIADETGNPENLDSFGTIWGKLYPSSALVGKRFEDLHLIGTAEDTLFNIEVLGNIEKIAYTNNTYYHYRKNIESSITSRYKEKLSENWDNLYNKISNIIQSNNLDERYASALNNRVAINALGIGLNCVSDDACFVEKYRRIKKVLSHSKRNAALKNLPLKYMPLHWKLFFFSARHKFALLFYILLMIITKLKGKV